MHQEAEKIAQRQIKAIEDAQVALCKKLKETYDKEAKVVLQMTDNINQIREFIGVVHDDEGESSVSPSVLTFIFFTFCFYKKVKNILEVSSEYDKFLNLEEAIESKLTSYDISPALQLVVSSRVMLELPTASSRKTTTMTISAASPGKGPSPGSIEKPSLVVLSE